MRWPVLLILWLAGKHDAVEYIKEPLASHKNHEVHGR